MVTRVSTLTFNGINIIEIDVQVSITPGIPAFTIVGLADKTIAESKERVKAALASIGLALPAKKITVNLAPADLLKEGSHLDLAIACALLTAMNAIPVDIISEYLIIGELSLDGTILPIAGALPAAIGAEERGKGLVCPESNAREAAWSGNQKIVAAPNLLSLINHFKGEISLPSPAYDRSYIEHEQNLYPDFADIIGQETAKRAIVIAAAGGHNLLMYGPPGSGKSMLAQRLPGILPEMEPSEILECSMVASIAGMLQDSNLIFKRPFRCPHHSCSMAAMVGGGIGRRVKPGEISLAHNGVLFLDELPEFSSQVIDALRQPIENGEISISRVNSYIKFPARFQLIAAMNPCKCGYLSDPTRACAKAPRCASDYQIKISGPIMDRFDMHIEVPFVPFHNSKDLTKVTSSELAKLVKKARGIQAQRFDGYGIRLNSQLNGQGLTELSHLKEEAQNFLNQSATKLGFSMRAYNRVIKVARTIADLEDEKYINKYHISEALSYRQISYQPSVKQAI